MSDFVVDSSVVAKWILAEADSAQALRLMRDSVSRGSKLIVLDLVFPEVANVIWKRARQSLISQGEATSILQALMRLPVSIEPTFPLLGPALDIAIKFDGEVYDSLFVALTSELSVSGVTADERLYNAIHHDFPSIQLLRDY